MPSKAMHPRNPYNTPVDFKQLALKDEEFRDHCTLKPNGDVYLNFHEDSAVRALSRAILRQDFGLLVDMPSGNLVPRVPARLNYLLLIEDVLKKNDLAQDVVGIDIGTGASCIYALLGTKRFGWKFVATDTSEASVASASRNVTQNDLQDKIEVVRIEENGSILKDLPQIASRSFTFCMCNPPFFEENETNEKFSEQSVGLSNNLDSSASNRRPPESATTARLNELQTEGGEVSFVRQMIDESTQLRDKIKIFTSLLGKKKSLQALKPHLDEIEGLRYTVYPMLTGKTQRWVLAWTFGDLWLEEKFFSIPLITLPIGADPLKWIEAELQKVEVEVERRCDVVIGRAHSFTWSRKRSLQLRGEEEPENKRKRWDSQESKKPSDTGEKLKRNDENKDAPTPPKVALQFRLSVDTTTTPAFRLYYLQGSRELHNKLKVYLESICRKR